MDITDFSATSSGTATIPVAVFVISGKLVDEDGTVVSDQTGVSACRFPQVMAALTPAQQQEIFQLIAIPLLRMRAGLE